VIGITSIEQTIQFKLFFMEHRGVRYTIGIGIEREQWRVAIHPPGWVAGREDSFRNAGRRRDSSSRNDQCVAEKKIRSEEDSTLKVSEPRPA
jgi:hypothetical protein